MAHKTLVNGTSYDITGGNTLVNGTGYSIKGGKTLVNGTGYDITLSADSLIIYDGGDAVLEGELQVKYYGVIDAYKGAFMAGIKDGGIYCSHGVYYVYEPSIDRNLRFIGYGYSVIGPIDVTNFSKLHVEGAASTDDTLYVGYSYEIPTTTPNTEASCSITSATLTEASLDISNVTGNIYITIAMTTSDGAISASCVTKIWLE